MVVWRRLGVCPVAQSASLTGDPVHAPATPRAVEHNGHELILDGVLGPQQMRVHESRRRGDAGLAVETARSLLHEPGPLVAQLRQLSGRP